LGQRDMPTSEAVSAAEMLYGDLVVLRQKDPTNKDLLENRVHGGMHLIGLYVRSGNLEKAQGIFDQLGEVVSESQQQEELREIRAGAAVNLAIGYGDAGFIDRVQAIYDDVKKTAEEFPNQPDLRDSQARIAANMGIDYLKRGQIDAVIEISDELKELAEAHPTETNLAREQVRLLAMLVFYYTDDDPDIKRARELYHIIVEASQRRPEDPFIRKAQADTAVSIIAKIDDLEET